MLDAKDAKLALAAKLRLFGEAARYMCSPEANYGPPCEVPILQLGEARAEWRRRHPELPLAESI
jgi:hypothetical protein